MRSGPTRRRQRLAVELTAPFLPGRRVVELGCGSGLLARRFLDAGAAGYLGIDHSRVAIEAARRRHEGAPGAEKIAFEVRSAAALPAGGGLIVSLGVLDWLTDAELSGLFARHGEADYLHTFSEYRAEPKQAVHRFLRAADAALRPNVVRPRFMTFPQLLALLPAASRAKAAVLRDAGLRDAAFLTNLPLPGASR